MSTATATAVAVVVSLGAGLGAGWWLGGRAAGTPSDPVERVGTAPPAGAGLAGSAAPTPVLEGQDPALKIAALEKARTALEQEKAALAGQVQDLKTLIKSLTPEPLDPKALRFGLAATTPTFDKADWSALSGHVSEMARIMPRLRTSMQEGGQPSPEVIQALQEHNTPLAMFAVQAAAELKGTGPNGAYTHPAVIANLIRAALVQANDPLSADQEGEIVARGYAWATDEERRIRALGPDAPALAGTVGEVDNKQRFLDAVKAVLTPSQRGVLFHPETENRLGLDLLSPALVYMVGIAPAEETDAAKLGAKALATLLASSGLKDLDSGPLASIGERWIDELPRGREARPPADPELRFPTVETIQGFARAQVAAMQRLIESGRLTPEQVTRLKKLGSVVAPYVVRAP